MCRNSIGFILLALIIAVPAVAEDVNDVNAVDTLIGVADINVVDDMIVSINYDDTEYLVAEGDLTLGTTTRGYLDANGVETVWVDGDPAPAATVSGTSNPKPTDIGPNADNFLLAVGGAYNLSSIDGINYQETIFPTASNTFFIFERGGNDAGSMQAILADGTLGEEVVFVKGTAGGPYAQTPFKVGQSVYGVAFNTVDPVMGVRINASGHDAFSVSIPTPDAYLTGVADINVVDDAIVSISYGGTEYLVAEGDLTLGTTTRWYLDANGVEIQWVDGDPAPAATVSGTSSPKPTDIGPNADNFILAVDGSPHISSIDGINFQETIFETPSDSFFVFERGGNDAGSMQAILADGTLGEEVVFAKGTNGGPYAQTPFKVGQSVYGVLFKTHGPVIGLRINASGHDAFSVSTPTPVIPD
ncbi:hypothetical protein ACFL6U_00815 [Planctomycetota bacterium]